MIAHDFSIQLIQDVKTEQVVIQILELPIGSATHLVVQEKVQAVPLTVSGPNCDPLGNVLIVQEPGADCPDDVSREKFPFSFVMSSSQR